MVQLAQLVATAAAGIFAGAAIVISLAEHPARMECGTSLAATLFGPAYRREAAMQAPLAVIGSAAAIGRWLLGGPAAWAAASLLLFLVVPFTLIVIMPTNRRLLDPALDRASEEARLLLVRWGRLHAVRSVLSLVAFVLMMSLIGR